MALGSLTILPADCPIANLAAYMAAHAPDYDSSQPIKLELSSRGDSGANGTVLGGGRGGYAGGYGRWDSLNYDLSQCSIAWVDGPGQGWFFTNPSSEVLLCLNADTVNQIPGSAGDSDVSPDVSVPGGNGGAGDLLGAGGGGGGRGDPDFNPASNGGDANASTPGEPAEPDGATGGGIAPANKNGVDADPTGRGGGGGGGYDPVTPGTGGAGGQKAECIITYTKLATPIVVAGNPFLVGATVTEVGGNAVVERGLALALTDNPTIDDIRIADAAGAGAFAVPVTLDKVLAATTYKGRYYAIDEVDGVGYSAQDQFTTAAAFHTLKGSRALMGCGR